MKQHHPRCGRCGKHASDTSGWSAAVAMGAIVSILCGSCQTRDEQAEAAVNSATLDFALINGRIASRPKGPAR